MWLIIRNARFADESMHSIFIHDGLIVAIDTQPIEMVNVEKSMIQEIDATSLYVLPGLIDGHVHFRLPGGKHKESWVHGTLAAIHGGVTYVADMPNTNPPLVSVKLLLQKIAAIGPQPIDYGLWVAATDENLDQLHDLSQHPKVVGFKIFREFSTGNIMMKEHANLVRACVTAQRTGKVVAVHVGSEEMIAHKRRALGREPLITDHCVIRDREVEDFGTQEIIEVQRRTGAHIHILHVSTAGSQRMIEEAKNTGAIITSEVSPHHVTITDTVLQGSMYPGYYKVNPPHRTAEDIKVLVSGMASGTVDTIGSDHAPHTNTEKRRKKYDSVPSGVPGVQTLGIIINRLMVREGMSRQRFVELTSTNMAHILGLNKGKIAPGYDADLVLWDPNKEVHIQNFRMKSKCEWTPYHGAVVRGVPTMTIAKGVAYKV